MRSLEAAAPKLRRGRLGKVGRRSDGGMSRAGGGDGGSAKGGVSDGERVSVGQPPLATPACP